MLGREREAVGVSDSRNAGEECDTVEDSAVLEVIASAIDDIDSLAGLSSNR